MTTVPRRLLGAGSQAPAPAGDVREPRVASAAERAAAAAGSDVTADLPAAPPDSGRRQLGTGAHATGHP
jgi:hypothetical protein